MAPLVPLRARSTILRLNLTMCSSEWRADLIWTLAKLTLPYRDTFRPGGSPIRSFRALLASASDSDPADFSPLPLDAGRPRAKHYSGAGSELGNGLICRTVPGHGPRRHRVVCEHPPQRCSRHRRGMRPAPSSLAPSMHLTSRSGTLPPSCRGSKISSSTPKNHVFNPNIKVSP